MDFSFIVNVHVERVTGKFISRAEIEEQLVEALEQANPDELWVDESNYELTDWAVEDNNINVKR